MHLALTDTFRAKWSADIHDEWMRNVLKSRPDLSPEQLERTRSLMDAHVRDSLVEGYEPLIDSIELPDANDRHVLAAAIKCQAELIITFNLKDFPEDALKPYSVIAQHPDSFVSSLLEFFPSQTIQAIARHRASLKYPPKTIGEYLSTLSQQRMTKTVAKLRLLADTF